MGKGYTKAMPEETQKALDTLFQRPVLSNGIIGGSSFAVSSEFDKIEFVSIHQLKSDFVKELVEAGFKVIWVHEDIDVQATADQAEQVLSIMDKYFPSEAQALREKMNEPNIPTDLVMAEETMEFKQEDWDKLNEINNP